MKTTLVIGASENPARYSYIATKRLLENKQQVILFGKKTGELAGISIETSWNSNWEVDTVTIYLSTPNQVAYYQKIIDLKPRRVIFNPGTENTEFIELLKASNIEAEIACTLVLISLGKY